MAGSVPSSVMHNDFSILPSSLAIYHLGKVLDESLMLDDYNILSGSTLSLSWARASATPAPKKQMVKSARNAE
jgi:hypothetical protein